MPRQRQTPFTQRVDLLDVRLLDMFAEVEAMLRYGREIQRHVRPLRVCSTPTRAARRRLLTKRLLTAVRQIRQELRVLESVIEQVDSAADALKAV